MLGAPRSGTNLLRDLLAAFPGAGTWPCDEINAIWRHGNVGYPTDFLPVARLTPAIRRSITRAFERLALRLEVDVVIEKTCANCLRVPFVDAVFPDAYYVHIIRDGRDATASAIRRWRAPFNLGYTLRKARYTPLSDVPYYVVRVLANRLHRLRSSETRLRSWGPRFSELNTILRTHGLAAACAAQWVQCVRSAEEGLAAAVDPARVLQIRYEDLVEHPERALDDLAPRLGLGLDDADDNLDQLVRGVHRDSIGNWRGVLDAAEYERIAPFLADELARHGYAA